MVAVDLQRSVTMYFIIALVSFSMVSCGESIGIIFNTLIIDSTGFALNIANTCLSIAIMMAGECFLRLLSVFMSEVDVFRYLVY